jgi:hypothetical protein
MAGCQKQPVNFYQIKATGDYVYSIVARDDLWLAKIIPIAQFPRFAELHSAVRAHRVVQAIFTFVVYQAPRYVHTVLACSHFGQCGHICFIADDNGGIKRLASVVACPENNFATYFPLFQPDSIDAISKSRDFLIERVRSAVAEVRRRSESSLVAAACRE